MKPNKPNKTESTFSTNKQISENSGQTDLKKEIKDVSVSLSDVDYAIKWHITNIIRPSVIEDNVLLSVPILFTGGEKWAIAQRHGYLRDNQGKILTPLIMIRRNSVSKREDIQDLKVLETPDARMTFERKYTKENRYDRFSLSNRPPAKELYSIDVPKFVQVDYELMCWCNNIPQMNDIIEQLIWFDGKAFGDSFKFVTYIENPSFETVNNVGEERIVRSTLSMRTKAHILNTRGPNAPMMYRIESGQQVVFTQELDSGLENFTNL